MPSLRLQRETSTAESQGTDPSAPRPSAEESAGVAGEPGGYDHDPRATGTDREDERGDAGASRRGTAQGRRAARDAGATTGYNRFSFKKEPPRIDPTQGGAPREERRETERADRDRQPERSRGGESLEDVLFSSGSELMSYEADVDRVVEKLYREIERKMRIENERRGL